MIPANPAPGLLFGLLVAMGIGSPASDSTLGPTSGLNVDGQHNHTVAGTSWFQRM